jgi:hypothetical protein
MVVALGESDHVAADGGKEVPAVRISDIGNNFNDFADEVWISRVSVQLRGPPGLSDSVSNWFVGVTAAIFRM